MSNDIDHKFLQEDIWDLCDTVEALSKEVEELKELIYILIKEDDEEAT
jgi:3-methyladenine DNA glycosylase AlkD